MADWRERLSSEFGLWKFDGMGSWRGIPFVVKAADGEIGRRNVIREYPGKDQPTSEDLGRRARRFTLTAYVVDNYLDNRDDLWKAFEAEGSGRLYHPWYGRMTCYLDGAANFRESLEQEGVWEFTATFVEAGKVPIPTTSPDTAEEVDAACDVAVEAAGVSLEAELSVAGLIQAALDEAESFLNAVLSEIRQIVGTVTAVIQAVQDISAAIDAIAATVAALILLPQTLVNAVVGIYDSICQAISTIVEAASDLADWILGGDDDSAIDTDSPSYRVELMRRTFGDMTTLTAFDPVEPAPIQTPTRIQMAANRTALVFTLKLAPTIETIRAATDLEFESVDQAQDFRDEVLEVLDDLIESATDTLYGPLQDLRATFARHMAQVAGDLPEISTYTPRSTMPALVIAQSIYGDSSKEADLINRNSIQNPLAVPGGVALEVLRSA